MSIDGTVCTDADADFPPRRHLPLQRGRRRWPYREHAYLLLNKPAGYECSRDPQHHLSVFSLLPPQFAERGVQCVGRLDQDTTGLLLLSDDGKFVHLFTSPKRKVPKVYVATTRHPLDDAQLDALRDGVLLHGEPKPIAAVDAEARDDPHARAHRDGRQVPPGQADDRGSRQPLRGAASRADRRTRIARDARARRMAMARRNRPRLFTERVNR